MHGRSRRLRRTTALRCADALSAACHRCRADAVSAFAFRRRASVEIRKLLEKALDPSVPDLPLRFVLNRYGPRDLIVPESAKALAKQDLPTPCEPRRPARRVRECCVQQSVRLEAP